MLLLRLVGSTFSLGRCISTFYSRFKITINSLPAKSCYGGEKHRNPVGFYSRNSTKSTLQHKHNYHKHHHHGGAVCPSFGVGSMDPPNWTRVTSSKGVGRGGGVSVLIKSINFQRINTFISYFIIYDVTDSTAIATTMPPGRYGASHIARWSVSVASCEATICCHRACACSVQARRTPWSSPLPSCENTHKTQLLASVYRTFYLAISFRSQRSKGTKRTLYSRHRCRKLHKIVTLHDESGRAQLTFQLSNANNGQKSLKLPIPKEACQKLGAHERQQLPSCQVQADRGCAVVAFRGSLVGV